MCLSSLHTDYFLQCKWPLTTLVVSRTRETLQLCPASTPKLNSPGTIFSDIPTVKLSPRRIARSKSSYGNSPRQTLGCPAEHLTIPAKTHIQPLAAALVPVLLLKHLGGTNTLIWEGKRECHCCHLKDGMLHHTLEASAIACGRGRQRARALSDHLSTFVTTCLLKMKSLKTHPTAPLEYKVWQQHFKSMQG